MSALRGRLPPPVALDPAAPAWPTPMRRAAVMAMVREHGGELVVTMIQRGDDAPVHAGQTALPGGRWEPSDVSLVDTARREVREELGIAADRLDVLGELDDLPTRTGFLVRPVLAVLDEPRYAPDPREVVDVFEVPLALFATPERAEALGVRELGGVRYPLRAYRWEGRKVWGISARILELAAALLRE